jgi:hypothetical protein
MTRNEIKGRRMVGLFLLGLLLFNFPILSLFDRTDFFYGIPILYLYLFLSWILFILLIFLIAQSRPHTLLSENQK